MRLLGSVLFSATLLLVGTFTLQIAHAQTSKKLRFEISFPSSLSASPLTGHMVLVLATKNQPEPRFQSGYTALDAAQMFGLDVNDWRPGTPATIDASVLGHPLDSLSQVSSGDYYTGGPINPPGIGGFTWDQGIFPKEAEWMQKTAPKGADMSWIY